MKHFDAAATEAALPFPALIAALRAAFREGAEAPLRHRHALPDGATLLLMPAWQTAAMGVKIVTVHPGNAARGLDSVHSTYLLLDARTGQKRALLDGDVLTARRTAAASALAASYLARPDSRRLLLVGAGRVASLMPAAHAVVRPITEVAVWNRSATRADILISALRAQGFTARRAGGLEDEVAWADIVSCATLATAPLIEGRWLRPGIHLDLAGAFTPDRREADACAVARASVFIDTEAALAEAGELAGLGRNDVRATLADLCHGRHAGRHGAAEITLFKSVGTALEDLSAATLAVGPNAA